ncbi:hypothetical protein BJF90_16565 [Pseudonocardia sp. CNS-004]|nr:hypothetical protein BJF90_16565 [Pseudonocardia sp. CNS-004]
MSQDDEFIRELLRRQDVADRELAAAREKHEEQTAAIKVLLAAAGWVNGAHVERPVAGSGVASGASAPTPTTTREYIRRALKDVGKPMKMAEIVETVGRMGSDATGDTIRTVLQKMLRAGQVDRPGRGMYGLRDEPPAPPSQEVLDMVSNLQKEAETPSH